MSRYRLGAFTTIADGTAVPSGDGVGTSVAALPGRDKRCWSSRIVVVASGAFSANLTLWRRTAAGNWGRLGPVAGDINGGTAFAESGAGTYEYELGAEFLGLHSELYYQVSDMTGISSVTVQVAPYAED